MPGPGHYDVASFIDRNHKNNKSFTLGKKKSYEYRNTLSSLLLIALNFPGNPGPGHYKDESAMSVTGSMFNSKYLSSGAQKFLKGS